MNDRYSPEQMKKIKSMWTYRLSFLTGISRKEANRIANEKMQYKEDCINKMEERQTEHFSPRRQEIIVKMRYSNPLKYIKDEAHANAILAASYRHRRSNYEEKLDEGRSLAERGIIDEDDVKEYARINFIRDEKPSIISQIKEAQDNQKASTTLHKDIINKNKSQEVI